MDQNYLSVVQNSNVVTMLTLPHKHKGAHPTGFVVRTKEQEPVPSFPFTICPLLFYKEGEEPPGTNPHDVLVHYSKDLGDLETLLYTLWEQYKEHPLTQTSCSQKRYRYTNTLPPRKLILPCLGRKDYLIATLKRFQMIDLPSEGYRPQICIVEHSPYYELEGVASEFNCEYLWFFLDPRTLNFPSVNLIKPCVMTRVSSIQAPQNGIYFMITMSWFLKTFGVDLMRMSNEPRQTFSSLILIVVFSTLFLKLGIGYEQILLSPIHLLRRICDFLYHLGLLVGPYIFLGRGIWR